MPKYLYPVSYMPMMLFPSGSYIPSARVALPRWMLTSARCIQPLFSLEPL